MEDISKFSDKLLDRLTGKNTERDKRDKEAKPLKKPAEIKAEETSQVIKHTEATHKESEKKLTKQVKPMQTPPPVPVPFPKATKKQLKESIENLNHQFDELKTEAFKIMDPKKQTLQNLLETKPEILYIFQQYKIDFDTLKKQIDAGSDKLRKDPEILKNLQELEVPVKALDIYHSQLQLQALSKKTDQAKAKSDEEQRAKAERKGKVEQAIAKGDEKAKQAPLQINPAMKRTKAPPAEVPDFLQIPELHSSTKINPSHLRPPAPESADRKESGPSQAESTQAVVETDQAAIKRSFVAKMKQWKDLHSDTFVHEFKFAKSPKDLAILKENSPILFALHSEIQALADKIPDDLTAGEKASLTKMKVQLEKFQKYL